MAVATATLVWVDKNKLVYLIANPDADGTAIPITSSGAATPDLATDVANAAFGEAGGVALRKACRSGLDGNGSIAAAGYNQAQARALLLLNGASAIGGVLTPRLQCRFIPATGTAAAAIDADVVAGVPKIVIDPTAAAGNGYLHVELVHSLTR